MRQIRCVRTHRTYCCRASKPMHQFQQETAFIDEYWCEYHPIYTYDHEGD